MIKTDDQSYAKFKKLSSGYFSMFGSTEIGQGFCLIACWFFSKGFCLCTFNFQNKKKH